MLKKYIFFLFPLVLFAQSPQQQQPMPPQQQQQMPPPERQTPPQQRHQQQRPPQQQQTPPPQMQQQRQAPPPQLQQQPAPPPPHHVEKELPPITPPAGPLPGHTVDIVSDAEFLYWYATTTNLAYATKYTVFSQGNATNPSARFVGPEKIYEPQWNWDGGVRLGIGVITNHDGWDVYSNWTWTYNSCFESINVQSYPVNDLTSLQNPIGTEALASPWFSDGTNSNFDSIQTRWSILLNQFDLELGRKFWISPRLVLRPFGGLRGHWSRMFFKVRGNYDSIGLGANARLFQETARRTQKFWAVGLLGGLQSNWYINRNWSVFINWAFSLLYGPFDIKTHLQSFGFNSHNQEISNFDQRFNHDDIYALQSVYDLAVGIHWELPIYDSAYKVSFDAGWESHLYPGYNHLDANVSASSNGATYLPAEGDLTLSGLVLRGQFEF